MKKTITLNCCIGDIVYKICPKCNDDHDGTCKHCAWEGCALPCSVTNNIYKDGSFSKNPMQIVPIRVNKFNFVYINETWNVHHFGSKIAAQQALNEFVLITQIKDAHERFGTFLEWVRDRQTDLDFNREV